ncbi:heterokaryon incompatibility protein-domain-containing protein [Rhexocercosporidium sp. MPI-PUGE-AT-0058]|nr:heterokaryon incompatibility protein-domain-containing protein [Rhexocercosporidium sp. MPI-PUGE-AT-0058]
MTLRTASDSMFFNYLVRSNLLNADIWVETSLLGQHIQFENVRMGKAPSGFTGSNLALNLALEWITDCTSKHKMCGDGSLRTLPTRVLDLCIGENCLEASIITGEGKIARYCTLSHCWGQRGNHRLLTKATLSSWLTAFYIGELPQTYQDVIAVTKQLVLRYLWIDSLCIIQDDQEDWERESSKMGDIYQNSYITIAATCAADSSVGMFSHARPIHRPRVVYQERLLSPRILHFLREELACECVETKRCECNYFPSARMSVKEKHAKSLDASLHRKLPLHSRWHSIVEEYCELSMTFEKDKLTAISGVARQVQSILNESYFAGLWSSSFKEDLYWRANTKFRRPKLQKWRAPSWSWAAINGRVICGSAPAVERSADILDLVCNPSSSDMLGELDSAWMEISGSFCKGMLHSVGSPDSDSKTFNVRTETGHNLRSVFLDYDISEDLPIGSLDIFLFLLYSSDEGKGQSGVLLLLRKVAAERAAYERIGITNLDVWSYFDSFPKTRIKVI